MKRVIFTDKHPKFYRSLWNFLFDNQSPNVSYFAEIHPLDEIIYFILRFRKLSNMSSKIIIFASPDKTAKISEYITVSYMKDTKRLKLIDYSVFSNIFSLYRDEDRRDIEFFLNVGLDIKFALGNVHKFSLKQEQKTLHIDSFDNKMVYTNIKF